MFEGLPTEDDFDVTPLPDLSQEIEWLLDKAIPIAQEFGSSKDTAEWRARREAVRLRLEEHAHLVNAWNAVHVCDCDSLEANIDASTTVCTNCGKPEAR